MPNKDKKLRFYSRVAEINGKGTILELKDSFLIDKICLSFRTFDSKRKVGEKITNYIDFYLDIDEFELLCHNLLYGYINKKLKNGDSISPYYKGSKRDGQIFARVLTFSSFNEKLVLTAYEGPGMETETKAVKPAYKLSDADNKVSISLNSEEVKAFALRGIRACDVYFQRYFGNTNKTQPNTDD